MATLVRMRAEQGVDQETVTSDLQRNIPTPFPSQRLIDLQDDGDEVLDELATETVDYDAQGVTSGIQNDIRTSIAVVQQSCLMTLANILSLSPPPSGGLHGIEHVSSTPASGLGLQQVPAETPLACLVQTLRTRDGHHDSSGKDHSRPVGEAALLSELHELVDANAPTLDRRDAHLAQAIVALLVDLEQLPASIASTSAQIISQFDSAQHPEDSASKSPFVHITSLQRQLSSLQPSAPSSSEPKLTAVETVQTALLWARIDQQLEVVMSLCKERASLSSLSQQTETAEPHPTVQPATPGSWAQDRAPSFDDHLPPEYDSEHHPNECPPSYMDDSLTYSSERYPDEKSSTSQYPLEKVSSIQESAMDTAPIQEKNRFTSTSSTSVDLELITHAIERLYLVAPQLSDQRVELRREKVMQMEKARQGKGKARMHSDVADPELDKMLELLGRASAREIPDQSVVIDPQRIGRERGTEDFEEQRRQYIEHLVDRSSAGRLRSQDAALRAGGTASPPNGADKSRDSSEEQSAELGHESKASWDGKRASFPPPPPPGPSLEPPTHERSRSRSLSATHLAWLRAKDKSGNASSSKDTPGLLARTISSDTKTQPQSSTLKSARRFSGRFGGSSKSRPTSAGGGDVASGSLDLAYIAEHHETLKHVLLFVALVGSSCTTGGGLPTAEVLPSASSGAQGDFLFLRLAGTPSPLLALPIPVVPGSKTVVSRSGHWEIKASCSQTDVPSHDNEDGPLLPAAELTDLSPWSYSCSSCSVALVPSPPDRYRDLPSEHWEELVDAWMCHPEGQTLAPPGLNSGDGGRGRGFGFWPTRQEGLVGGSYILFDAEAVANGNIKCVASRERGDHTCLARCICGAILGRRHERKHEDGSSSRMYRFFKYAIRPNSATSQTSKIPMSAFVLRDMLEHVQAHATYRFVLSDEEEERPRILIWLFKPRMRLSYMVPTPSLLPKSGSVDASKVLYKILGPTSTGTGIKEIVNRYPGFPQAEHLFYPMDVCRQLAGLLMESTLSYPESMRTMTGLDVGWLARS